jgi:C-terminal processing protease CtpA/Prc
MAKMTALAVLIGTVIPAWLVRAQDPTKEPAKPQVKPSAGREAEQTYKDYANVYLDALSRKEQSLVAFQGPGDDLLGATLQPVGDTLREQLAIKAGQGLVVEALRADGACAQAGLQQNDVLLLLADKPLNSTNDLNKGLKEAGDSAVPLRVLREGKPITIQVRPIYHVTIGPVREKRTEYFLGVSVVGPNETVRAQLGLPDGQGVVVTEVEGGSPAEKAGIKKHDIIMELRGIHVWRPEDLSRAVQEAEGQSMRVRLLHGGKSVTLTVTPVARKVDAQANYDRTMRLFLNRSTSPASVLLQSIGRENDQTQALRQWITQPAPTEAEDVRQRLEHLEKELNGIRAALDRISETLKTKR